MPEEEKQPLGDTARELIHIYSGKIQEEPDYILYSNYFPVREIPYKIQKEEMEKVIRKNINILLQADSCNCKRQL